MSKISQAYLPQSPRSEAVALRTGPESTLGRIGSEERKPVVIEKEARRSNPSKNRPKAKRNPQVRFRYTPLWRSVLEEAYFSGLGAPDASPRDNRYRDTHRADAWLTFLRPLRWMPWTLRMHKRHLLRLAEKTHDNETLMRSH